MANLAAFASWLVRSISRLQMLPQKGVQLVSQFGLSQLQIALSEHVYPVVTR